MRSVLRLSAVAGLLVGGLSAAWAADDKPFSDDQFIAKAASGGMHEVELGKLAKDRASNPDVKKFGERMVTDHTKANGELKDLAKAMGIAVTGKMNEEDQKEIDKFKTLRGREFDTAYMKHMVDDHEKDVKLFEKAAKECKDARLRQWAEKTLPTLKEHLDMAKKINDQLQKQ